MCLTEDAYQERKWGRYPALRTVLEDKTILSGLPSICDTFPDYLGRTLEIAELALQNPVDVRETARFLSAPDQMRKDLDTLATDLERAARSLIDLAKDIRGLRSGLLTPTNVRSKFKVLSD